MAAARAAENRHQAIPRGTSPLDGVTYQGDLSLLRFSPVPVDEFVDEFVDRFEASSPEDRARQRSALTMRDFYTLLAYARRVVLRALRSGDDSVARRGVIALTVVDSDRVDWRDVAWQAGLLSYALGRISGDVVGLFQAASELGEGQTADLLTGMAREPVASLSQWGFREIRTADGAGLTEDEGKPYQPTSDLLALAAAVAGSMHGDRWRLGDPVTGTGLPSVWLRAGEPEHVEPALRSVTGCVTLRGSLTTQKSPFGAQYMLIFLAETSDSAAASVIAQAAGPPGTGSAFAAVSAAHGMLCAVMIARSVVQGTPSVETQASLERFRPVLADALGGVTKRRGPVSGG